MNALKTIGISKAFKFLFFTIVQNLLHWAILPPIRNFWMRMFGATIGANSVLFDVQLFNAYHYGLSRLLIGDNCFLGDGVMLDVRGGIRLGHHVTLSNRVSVVTHINVGYEDHPIQKHYPTSENEVVIEDGTYVGTGAVILPGVRLGKECVVGAGAVVTKDVAARTVVAGVPARVIKKLAR